MGWGTQPHGLAPPHSCFGQKAAGLTKVFLLEDEHCVLTFANSAHNFVDYIGNVVAHLCCLILGVAVIVAIEKDQAFTSIKLCIYLKFLKKLTAV